MLGGIKIQGSSAIIRGSVTGEGPMRVVVTNRDFSKTSAVPGSFKYKIRAKLFPGRNRIVLQSLDSQGTLSLPKRITVLKR